MEGRYVATADIIGAFLQNNHDKGDIHINMDGAMETIHKEIDPDCYK